MVSTCILLLKKLEVRTQPRLLLTPPLTTLHPVRLPLKRRRKFKTWTITTSRLKNIEERLSGRRRLSSPPALIHPRLKSKENYPIRFATTSTARVWNRRTRRFQLKPYPGQRLQLPLLTPALFLRQSYPIPKDRGLTPQPRQTPLSPLTPLPDWAGIPLNN